MNSVFILIVFFKNNLLNFSFLSLSHLVLFFFLNLYLLQDNWLYNIVFISAIYQHESATGVHISPPS